MSNKKLEFARGEIIASKYEVVDLLDQSPLGLTYRVKHLKSGKYVRLTMLRPEIAGREQKEAVIEAFKKARANQNPNLIRVGELADHNGVGYFVTEDFEGSTLRELIQEYRIGGRMFTLKEASQIVIQILEGLAAIHDEGACFRALRPEYVLVRIKRTGPRQSNFVSQVKLVGYGFWDLVPPSILAEDEFARGEAQYLAPELKSFDPEPTERSDLYSAAVMFYEMLVGTAPVGTFQLPRQRRPDLPQHVDGVVEVGLATAPEDRYPAAKDLVADIQRANREAAFDEPVETPKLNPLIGVLAVVLVVAVAAILFNLQSDPRVEAESADARLRTEVAAAHETREPGEIRAILAAYPQNMMYVPGGPYIKGRLNQEFKAPRSEPLAESTHVEPFLIDLFEYPNKRDAPPKFNATHNEAERLCSEAGKRLCTADEWEKTCKGPSNTIYSYGDTFDQDFCGLDGVYRSGSMTECRSGWGVFDLSGNFREWTSDMRNNNPSRRLVKGGQRQNPERGTRCAFSEDLGDSFSDVTLSFRCCMDFSPSGQ